MNPRPFPVIMGPTASGKSSLAIAAALAFHGEIISMDSMQVYRGLDIGTAKPSTEERKTVPHHLVDILDLHERTDLFSFREKAEDAIRMIREKNSLPIPAGGTGLYLKALIYGLDNMPADRALRDRINTEFDSQEGFPRLLAIMKKEVPDDYEKWHLHQRRLLRAYEIFLLTGKSMTELQKTWKKPAPRPDARQFVLEWDRDQLKQRIRSRCAEMLKNGWIEETERLEKQGLFDSPTAWQALGYPLIRDFLHGKLHRNELEDKISTATWQFARRQITWFNGQHPEAVRLAMPSPEHVLLRQIESALQQNDATAKS